MQQIVVGTAGHIDHGKTSLVKALTGTDTDTLPQEKMRGMTIDLGFAYLNESVTIIDVPGHEKFIRNMAAGASSIHVGLLVIAADDGVMPQTREHVEILNIMGIQQGLIAITKIDLVDDPEWIDLVELDILSLVEGSVMEGSEMCRVSTETGEGIEALSDHLIKTVGKVKIVEKSGLFKMNVDRVFSKTGFGVIVAGTVDSGEVQQNDMIECLPGNIQCKIRGIQSHGGEVKLVKIGDRAAFNLTHIEKGDIARGSVLSSTGSLQTSDTLIVCVTLLKNTKWKLKNKQRIRLNIGTNEILARVNLLGRELSAGEEQNIYLSLEKPIAVVSDEAFVVRSYSPMETIAGACVLDTQPKTWRVEKNHISELPTSAKDRFAYWVNSKWKSPKTKYEWSITFFVTMEKMDNWIQESAFIVEPITKLIYSKKSLEQVMNAIEEFIVYSYKKNPLRNIIPGESILENLKIDSQWGHYALETMIDNYSLEKKGKGYNIKGYSYTLNVEDEQNLEAILKIFPENNFDPISLKDLNNVLKHPPKRLNDLIHLLKENMKIVAVGTNLWLKKESEEKLQKVISKYFAEKDSLSVSDFKDLTSQSRKGAIPLLEYCDKKEWTVRSGNERQKGAKLDD